ncbi:hypothetical protein VTI74DRAFT_7699 [Chaetomium olivicolor]
MLVSDTGMSMPGLPSRPSSPRESGRLTKTMLRTVRRGLTPARPIETTLRSRRSSRCFVSPVRRTRRCLVGLKTTTASRALVAARIAKSPRCRGTPWVSWERLGRSPAAASLATSIAS